MRRLTSQQHPFVYQFSLRPDYDTYFYRTPHPGRSTMDLTWHVQLHFQLVVDPSSSASDAKKSLCSLLNLPDSVRCSLGGCGIAHPYTAFPEHNNELYDPSKWSCWIRSHPSVIFSSHPSKAKGINASEPTRPLKNFAVALTSPDFALSSLHRKQTKARKDHRPGFDPKWQVARLLRILESVNTVTPTTNIAAVYVDENCYLRVRIGSSASRYGDIHLQTFKNVLEITAKYERLFDSIRDANQIRRGPFDALGWSKRVQASPSWRELIKISLDTPPAFSTRLVHWSAYQGAELIFPGTFSQDEVSCAIDVATCLTTYAGKASFTEQALGMWNAFIPNFSYTLPHFLQRIGVSERSLALVRAKLVGSEIWPTYAEALYGQTMLHVAPEHALFELLKQVATRKRFNSDRISIEMAVNEKMREGQYGWFPQGSEVPWHLKLPVFDAELPLRAAQPHNATGPAHVILVDRPSISEAVSGSPRVIDHAGPTSYSPLPYFRAAAVSGTSERSVCSKLPSRQDSVTQQHSVRYATSPPNATTYYGAHEGPLRDHAESVRQVDLRIDERGCIDWHPVPCARADPTTERSNAIRRWTVNFPLRW